MTIGFAVLETVGADQSFNANEAMSLQIWARPLSALFLTDLDYLNVDDFTLWQVETTRPAMESARFQRFTAQLSSYVYVSKLREKLGRIPITPIRELDRIKDYLHNEGAIVEIRSGRLHIPSSELRYIRWESFIRAVSSVATTEDFQNQFRLEPRDETPIESVTESAETSIEAPPTFEFIDDAPEPSESVTGRPTPTMTTATTFGSSTTSLLDPSRFGRYTEEASRYETNFETAYRSEIPSSINTPRPSETDNRLGRR